MCSCSLQEWRNMCGLWFIRVVRPHILLDLQKDGGWEIISYELAFSSRSCQCPFGWKGALCSETMSVCDAAHAPPPLCALGSTCIPLPNGYTCHCPLGTAGVYCEKGHAITRNLHHYTCIFFFSLFILSTRKDFRCSII